MGCEEEEKIWELVPRAVTSEDTVLWSVEGSEDHMEVTRNIPLGGAEPHEIGVTDDNRVQPRISRPS